MYTWQKILVSLVGLIAFMALNPPGLTAITTFWVGFLIGAVWATPTRHGGE
jgi:hypothetical protein